MKKIFMFLFVLGLSIPTWQSYNPNTKVLTVHMTADPRSPIFYQGPTDGYTTNPAAFFVEWPKSMPLPTGNPDAVK